MTYGSEPEFLSPVGLNIYLGHTKPDNWNLWVDDVRNNIIGHREDARKVAEKELKLSLTNSEVTHFWLSKTFSYIAKNPWLYLKAQSQKLSLLFSPSSYLSQEAYHHWRNKAAPLTLAFINFSVIFPLFVIGVFLLRRTNNSDNRSQTRYFTILSGMLYLASLMATIVIERYRVAAFVFMIPIASHAVIELLKLNKNRFRLVAALMLMFIGSQLIGQFAKPTMSSDRLSRLETEEKEQRLRQKSWFNLRSKLDNVALTKETCFDMQNALIDIGYHRDLKALALACARK